MWCPVAVGVLPSPTAGVCDTRLISYEAPLAASVAPIETDPGSWGAEQAEEAIVAWATHASAALSMSLQVGLIAGLEEARGRSSRPRAGRSTALRRRSKDVVEYRDL